MIFKRIEQNITMPSVLAEGTGIFSHGFAEQSEGKS